MTFWTFLHTHTGLLLDYLQPLSVGEPSVTQPPVRTTHHCDCSLSFYRLLAYN